MSEATLPRRGRSRSWTPGAVGRADALNGFTGLLLVALIAPQGDALPPELKQVLHGRLGFSSDAVERLRGGGIVTRVPETESEREIAVVGAVRLDVPVDLFAGHFREIVRSTQTETASDIGLLGMPPTLDDLAGLRMPLEDLRALERCEVGRCEVKLPADAIRRFQRGIDWSSDRAIEAADSLARRLILDYARAYLSGGDSALAPYADKPEPLSVADGFDHLLGHYPFLRERLPGFRAYLADYPHGRLEGSESLLFWSRESFGLKPVVTLTHAILYRDHESAPARAAMALKQLYATHYFQVTLGLMLVVDATGPSSGPRSYLVYLDRKRFDGEVSGFGRLVIERGLEDSFERRLRAIRDRLMESYEADAGG